ncbi:SAM-dependent methyltransferase [Actinokineospora sp. G85]|uniref:SAM-dependent methyltransferase n=1 Tax=Actinokineospora sp. G85 TaxID=3406626 RepID=UPI003C7481CB
MSLGANHFRALYAADPDPWGFRTRWYEERKRAATMAALTRQRYRSAFEPGCSIGVLTTALADRCDAVLGWEVDAGARAEAQAAVPAHVRVEPGQVPRDWPEQRFDLLVVSEIGYFLDTEDLRHLIDRCTTSLDDDGELVLVHWRHRSADTPLDGDTVHAEFLSRSGLHPLVSHSEPDFRLTVLAAEETSIAAREGLC